MISPIWSYPAMPEMKSNYPVAVQREWTRVVPKLYGMGRLRTSLDIAILNLYCVYFIHWKELNRRIRRRRQKKGQVVTYRTLRDLRELLYKTAQNHAKALGFSCDERRGIDLKNPLTMGPGHRKRAQVVKFSEKRRQQK
jgi:phage terminase small subunit